MRCLILCGGYGTRLGLKTKPKPMVKVNGKPVLEHIIDHLNKYGITEIIVKFHYMTEVIMKYFGTKVLYYYEPILLDVEQSEKNLDEWLDGEYIEMNGDTLTDVDISEMRKRLQNHQGCVFTKNGRYAGTKIVSAYCDTAKEEWDGDGAYYFDIGTPEKLTKARRFFKDKK